MNLAQETEAALHRSEQFRLLLENKLLVEAFDAIRDEAVATWRSTGISEAATREDAWQMHRAVDRLQRFLATAAAAGEVQAHNARAALKKLGK